MATETLEVRVEKLESKVQEVEARLSDQLGKAAPKKCGWRWFVGIDANNPHFDDAVRLGQEWRFADRPTDDERQIQLVPVGELR
jgi:hypothetical protein